MSLLFITLLRFVIAFLPQSKHLLISWLQSSSTVTLESEKMKLVTASNFSPSVFCEVMGTDAMILVFFNVVFKTAFHSLLSPLSRISLVPFHFLPLQWYHLHISGCYYSSLESSIIYDSSNIVFFFLESPYFLHDPTNVGLLISSTSAFLKPSLCIWKCSVHILLKSLKDFDHNLQHVKWTQLHGSFNLLCHCSSMGLKWKLIFFSPVATYKVKPK